MNKLIVGCLLLGGCAGAEPEPTMNWDRGPAPTPSRSRVPTNSYPQEIPTLSLERACAIADSIHPELAAARARVEASDGRAHQAGLSPNPLLVARMESAPFKGGTTGNAEYLAGVSQRIPIGGRLGAARESEMKERERLIDEYYVHQIEVRSRVHGAFAVALYATEVVRIGTEASKISERAVTVARARRAAGDLLPEEVARVEMEQFRTALELDHAGGLRDMAFVALASAVGDSLLRIGAVEGNLEAALEVPAIESILEGLGRSPYAALAEAEQAVVRARIDQAKLERIPDVSLDLFYRRLEQSKTNAFDVGVILPLPLFDRNQGKLRELEAESRGAQARAQGIRNDAVRKAREAHIQLTEAMHHARLLKSEILPRAETVLQGAEVRFAGGDMSLAEVLPIRRDRFSSQLAYLEALREVMEAWARLRPFLKEK
jgi:outer membrane protein, heavy metal efflux system